MSQIRLRTEVDENREVRIQLPDDAPIGTVELIIEYRAASESEAPLTREEIRRRLLEGDLLSTDHYAPEDAIELSEEEANRIGKLLVNPKRSSLDYINEDREDRI